MQKSMLKICGALVVFFYFTLLIIWKSYPTKIKATIFLAEKLFISPYDNGHNGTLDKNFTFRVHMVPKRIGPVITRHDPLETISSCIKTEDGQMYSYSAGVILHPQNICNNSSMTFLVFVTSKLSNTDRRQAIRETWGNQEDIEMEVFFVVGNTSSPDATKQIREEAEKYGDILQVNVKDDYRNLVYKILGSFQWININCLKKPKYIIKSDDDTFLNIPNILTDMDAVNYTKPYIMCWVMPNPTPHREPSSPWYLSYSEYPDPKFPEFCSGGGGYAFPAIVIRHLFVAKKRYCPIFLEDVYTTGMLRVAAGIGLEGRNDKIFYLGTNDICKVKYGLTSHYVSVALMRKLWATLPDYSCANPFA